MTPEQLALLGLVDIPFDILKIVDSGNGFHSRRDAISSLKDLDIDLAASELKLKLDIYHGI